MSAEKDVSLELKTKLEGTHLEFVKKVGPNGKLFGSVTQQDIADELGKKGISVEKRVITITNPIKSVGTFTIKAKLFADVEAKFQVKVVIDPTQIEELKAAQAAAEKRKKDKKAEAVAAAADAAANGEKVTVEQTEEDRLRAEANRILRS
jgi:large subunit ribosomal protein L9